MPSMGKTVSDFVDAGMPSVAIQRILLETSALSTGKIYSVDGFSGTSRVKDPHIMMSATDMPTDDSADNLKITLNLSLQGFLQKNSQLSKNASGLWFDDISVTSLVTAKIYQIDAGSFEFIKNKMSQRFPNKKQWKLNDLDVIDIIKTYNEKNSQTINIADILFQADSPAKIQKNKAQFISTNSDGSKTYNLPYTLNYTLLDKNPEFLAYVIITEFDYDLFVDQLVGSEDDVVVGSMRTEDLKELVASLVKDISAESVKYDVVFNRKTLNSTAAVLARKDNNTLWFGNWHTMPDGTIMTGAKHNDKSLSLPKRDKALKPVKVANTKIIDLRANEEINKVFLKELYEVGDVYDSLSKINKYPTINDKSIKPPRPAKHSFDFMSSHADGSYSYILGLNKKTILLNKSSYSAIADNIIKFFEYEGAPTSGAFAGFGDILAKTKILDLRLFRTRVNNNENSQNRLGTRVNEQSSFIRPTLNTDITNSYEDSIAEEIGVYSDFTTSTAIKRMSGFNFADDASMLFLTFKDTLQSKNGLGQYQYHYEVIFEDGIRLFLEEIFLEAHNNFARLKKYINFIDSNLPLYYNDSTDKFNTDNIVSLYDKKEYNNNLDEIFTDLKKSLNNIFTLFSGRLDTSMRFPKALQNLVIISSPSTGNYQGLLKFYDISETTINKFLGLTGFNKNILKIKKTTKLNENNEQMIYEAPVATEGSISNLSVGNTSLQKQKGTPKNSIILKERLTNIVDLEDFKKTGYDYLHTDIYPNPIDDKTTPAMAGKTPDPLIMQGNIEVGATKFLDRITAEKFKYFSQNPENFRDVSLWNIDLNSSHFLSPSKVVVGDKTIPLNRRSNGKFNHPALMDMSSYKEAVLDILRYFVAKDTNKVTALTVGSAELERFDSKVSPEHLAAIKTLKKLLHTAAPMGVAFPNELYEHSSFLSAPSTGLSTISKKLGGSKEYENSLLKSITSTANKANEIDNLLFGMLNGIVLEKNKKLSIFTDKDYSFPFNQNTKIPNSIKSLFMSTYGANNYPDANAAVVQQFDLEDVTFESLPLSLETFGWWWFNYSNIVEIKYMSSINESCTPVWSDLTLTALNDIIGSNKRVLCKFFKYHRPQFGIQSNKLLDLPIFDEYFVIKPTIVVPQTNIVPTIVPLSPPISSGQTSNGIFGPTSITPPQSTTTGPTFTPAGLGGSSSPSSTGGLPASGLTGISVGTSAAAVSTPGLSGISTYAVQGATNLSMVDSVTGGSIPVSAMNIPETAIISDDTLDVVEDNSVFSGLIDESVKSTSSKKPRQSDDPRHDPRGDISPTTSTSKKPITPTTPLLLPKGYF